jgi:hypothetical protein
MIPGYEKSRESQEIISGYSVMELSKIAKWCWESPYRPGSLTRSATAPEILNFHHI